jgi:hypothetical protein
VPMRPHSRLQNTTDESTPIDELLLAEADDLAPLTTTRDNPFVAIDDDVTDTSPPIPSDVPHGRAVDIGKVDNDLCYGSPFDACGRFVSSFSQRRDALTPTESIYSWAAPDHCDHWHLGYD